MSVLCEFCTCPATDREADFSTSLLDRYLSSNRTDYPALDHPING
ncbi:hypothetical protein [Baia soyae]|nr:hypothetical protein [Baia soyae]